jgi:hypothetical protein
MDIVNQILMNPVLITGIILSVFAVIGKFFRVWIASIMSCMIIGAIMTVIVITIGQIIKYEAEIRFVITSVYRVGGLITLSFGDILLIVLLVFAFILALCGHLLNIERTLQERLNWLPRRSSHHYEMEHTLRMFFRRKKENQ